MIVYIIITTEVCNFSTRTELKQKSRTHMDASLPVLLLTGRQNYRRA